MAYEAVRREVIRIANGPGKFDLMLSLFDSTWQKPRLVEFELDAMSRFAKTTRISCKISMVQQEDGSGEGWNFEGGIVQGGQGAATIRKGYYSTKSRKGSVEIHWL